MSPVFTTISGGIPATIGHEAVVSPQVPDQMKGFKILTKGTLTAGETIVS